MSDTVAIIALVGVLAGTGQDVERLAAEGWRAARALAPVGAPRDTWGPVNDVLRRLDPLFADPAARYADAAVRAALAAAQEEREEMAVYLAHARDLSVQMALAGEPARWPLPIDELAGELWLEVDRFLDARDAYRRATATGGSPRAWLGLARASDRLGDRAAACDAYRRVTVNGLGDVERQEVAAFVRGC